MKKPSILYKILCYILLPLIFFLTPLVFLGLYIKNALNKEKNVLKDLIASKDSIDYFQSKFYDLN